MAKLYKKNVINEMASLAEETNRANLTIATEWLDANPSAASVDDPLVIQAMEELGIETIWGITEARESTLGKDLYVREVNGDLDTATEAVTIISELIAGMEVEVLDKVSLENIREVVGGVCESIGTAPSLVSLPAAEFLEIEGNDTAVVVKASLEDFLGDIYHAFTRRVLEQINVSKSLATKGLSDSIYNHTTEAMDALNEAQNWSATTVRKGILSMRKQRVYDHGLEGTLQTSLESLNLESFIKVSETLSSKDLESDDWALRMDTDSGAKVRSVSFEDLHGGLNLMVAVDSFMVSSMLSASFDNVLECVTLLSTKDASPKNIDSNLAYLRITQEVLIPQLEKTVECMSEILGKVKHFE